MGCQLMSMKKQIFLFLLKLFFGICILSVLWVCLTNLFIRTGILIPANYSETVLEQNKAKLLSVDEISVMDLPIGCTFNVYDYKYNIKYGNMSTDENRHALDILKGNKSSIQGNFIYHVITREKDVCVVKYNMKAYLNILNGAVNFLDYNLLSCICIVICYFFYVYLSIRSLTKRWQLEFKKIEKITSEIQKNNLDFQYSESKIIEFENAINSIISMRETLKETLYKSWEIENEKIEQIGALIHDIKIPLTVIKGNTELMIDYNKKEHYNSYHLYSSLESIDKIEHYILLLLQYVKAEHIENDNIIAIDAKEFSKLIIKEIEKYTNTFDVNLQINVGEIQGKICVNYFSMERAILNLIDNAIQYRKKEDEILCYFGKESDKFVCSVSNRCGKFNDEVLINASKLFYTSDKSRNSLHYGLGLAYVNKVVDSSHGTMNIYNCEKRGATVKLLLPLIE